jgi:hypothetical protein
MVLGKQHSPSHCAADSAWETIDLIGSPPARMA